MKMRPTGWALALLLVVGCGGGGGGGGGGGSISMQPLSGKIGGQAWTFGTGETMSASFVPPDRFFVTLYPDSFETCVPLGAPTDVNLVTMQMPKDPGNYDLNNQLNASLYVVSTTTNYAATSGTLVIDSVTATTISGGLHATYNGNNSVDGQFSAAICP
jgi:hypothetical protein